MLHNMPTAVSFKSCKVQEKVEFLTNISNSTVIFTVVWARQSHLSQKSDSALDYPKAVVSENRELYRLRKILKAPVLL